MAEGKPYDTEPKERPKPTHFLRQWRKFFGLTQAALSEESGVDDGTISALERGEFDPKMETLQMLADGLGITRGMLLEVNPTGDEPLWQDFFRLSKANKTQREQAQRHIHAVIGPPRPVNRPEPKK